MFETTSKHHTLNSTTFSFRPPLDREQRRLAGWFASLVQAITFNYVAQGRFPKRKKKEFIDESMMYLL
jgi:hypothetical protein